MTEPNATHDLALDGNAVAGVLEVAFGRDMSGTRGRCVHCGTVHVVAELIVYRSGPGDVLRCRACGKTVIRIVERAEGVVVDASGQVAIDGG